MSFAVFRSAKKGAGAYVARSIEFASLGFFVWKRMCVLRVKGCYMANGHSSVFFRLVEKLEAAAAGQTSTGACDAQRLTNQELADGLEAGLIKQDGSGRFLLTSHAINLLKRETRQAVQSVTAQRGKVHVHKSTGRRRTVARRSETPLDWLLRRKDRRGQALISQSLYDAGCRLARDFVSGQMAGRVTMDWSRVGVGREKPRGKGGAAVELGDRVSGAQDRVRSALAAVGPELSGILVDVCCFEIGLEDAERKAGWPTRSGKVVLQLALERLARHYGLIRHEAGPQWSRLRHWGDADYRPLFEVDAECVGSGEETASSG